MHHHIKFLSKVKENLSYIIIPSILKINCTRLPTIMCMKKRKKINLQSDKHLRLKYVQKAYSNLLGWNTKFHLWHGYHLRGARWHPHRWRTSSLHPPKQQNNLLSCQLYNNNETYEIWQTLVILSSYNLLFSNHIC